MTIALPKEFSFEHALSFLKRSPREILHRVNEQSVMKALEVEGKSYVFQIDYHPHELVVNFLNNEPTSIDEITIANYIIEWFDIQTNLKPFYQLAKGDALLSPLVKKYFGYRIVGQPDLFESLVWAVLGQQINLAFAYTLKQRFVEQFGKRVEWNGQPFFLFPTPHVVKQIEPEQLIALQFSKQKAMYTINIANAFAEQVVSKERLATLPLTQAKEELMKVKGVGNWTANYALMKTFRHPDAFPLEDAGVHNAIKNLKRMKSKPTLDQVRRVFKKYKGWEAYATLYLWKSL